MLMRSRYQPALATVLTFLGLIILGTFALFFFGFKAGTRDTLLSAEFTAVSGVCVTGLSIINIGQDLSFTGQLILLVLIQLGGLGLLTLSNWILLSLRGRISLTESMRIEESLGGLPSISPVTLLKRLVFFTAVSEGIGFLILLLRFSLDYPLKRSMWLAAFHSVSAFCNAGFSLFPDSLTAYRGDFIVNLTIIGLIVAGGLGFVAVADIAEALQSCMRKRRPRLSLHTKVVLLMTGALILFGWLAFLLLESDNTLAGRPITEKVLAPLFLSVTARTAGFNSLATSHLTNITLVLLMILMIVGASPGSTGGGIKTTTAAIIWSMVKSHIFNRPRTEVLGRSIPSDLLAKALAVTTLYLMTLFISVAALEWTELGNLPHSLTRGLFMEHLFEVISALSTVGLSMGATQRLSPDGLEIIIFCMFVGRIGPLILASSLVGERQRLAFSYPEEGVMIG